MKNQRGGKPRRKKVTQERPAPPVPDVTPEKLGRAIVVGLKAAADSYKHTLGPADLTEEEQKHYDVFLTGFRKAQSIYNVRARHATFAELLGILRKKKDLTAEWRKHSSLADTLHPIASVSQPSAKAAERALETLIAECRETLDPADKLRGMERSIRAVVGRLSLKARTIIGILETLACLEGLSIGLDFGNKILYGELPRSKTIKNGLAKLAGDADIKTMGEAYQLTQAIEESEERK